MHGFILSLAFFLGVITQTHGAQRCRCLAGNSCFPNAVTLGAFSKTLARPLISGLRPPAAVCYTNTADFNAAACTAATAAENNPFDLAQLPNAVQYFNFEEIVNTTTLLGCPYDPSPGDVCHQGRVPSFAVDVATVSDIQNTFAFATKHNLHLVVRNTGYVRVPIIHAIQH
jgi:hypothetical protein